MSDPGEHENDAPEAEPIVNIPNAADAKSVARARQLARFKGDQRGDFWRMVMGYQVGRMVMWEMLTSMGTFQDRFATTPAGFECRDATMFQLGEKAVGQRLYQTLMLHDLDAVHLMHEEQDGYFKPKKRKKRTTLNG